MAQQPRAPLPAKIKLMYFDAFGAAEGARYLLALGGLFPGAGYEDYRLPAWGDWVRGEADGEFGPANMDRLPLLEVDGVRIGHSAAIERYLAALLGLNGRTLVDAGLIDGVCSNIGEMVGAFRRLVPFARDLGPRRAAALQRWFDTEAGWERARAGEEQGRVLRDDRMLPFFLRKLEACVGDDGYAVGGRVSLADVKLYLTFVDQPAHGVGFADKADGSRLPPPTEVIRANAAEAKASIDRCLKAAPKIARILTTFAAHPNVKKYEGLGPRGDGAAFHEYMYWTYTVGAPRKKKAAL